MNFPEIFRRKFPNLQPCLWLVAHRSQERSKRNSVDLCICVYECRGTESIGGPVGPLLCSSKREVRYFAGTNCFLEPGIYLVFAMAFNHWSLGMHRLGCLISFLLQTWHYVVINCNKFASRVCFYRIHCDEMMIFAIIISDWQLLRCS